MVLDRLIATISPSWALKRQINRKQLERIFDAAQSSQYFKRRTDTRSPDAVMDNAREKLRVITRHLDENHDLAIGVLDALTNNVIGSGINIEPMIKSRNGKTNEKLNTQIAEQWQIWAEQPEITGEIPWGEFQRLVFRSWMRDGEIFIRHLEGRQYGDYSYQLQALESDFLSYDINSEAPSITHGVQKNAAGQPTGYHFYKKHPGNTINNIAYSSLQLETQRVPADQVSHLKFVRRFHQTRGQPLLHGCIRRLESIHEYEQSEQIAARVAAEFTAFIKRAPDMTGAANLTADGDRSFEMQAGMIFDGLLPGEDVGSIGVQRPNPELGNFRNSMLRAIASGTGTTFSQISRDYRESNYSSQRQELIEAGSSYRRLQELFITTFLRPVYRRFINQLRLTGKIELARFGMLEDFEAYAADYQGPSLPWIDPEKEAKAAELLITNQLESREHLIRSRGRNPRIVRQQIENEQMELALDQPEGNSDDQRPNQSEASGTDVQQRPRVAR